jgi:hypothetical protein
MEPPISPKVVFARSSRYHHPTFPWKEMLERYREEAIFVGTSEEHELFVKSVGAVPFVATKNILELSIIIANSKLFIGNLSLPYALAEGFKVNSIQETSPMILNCIYPRPNAQYFIDGDLVIKNNIGVASLTSQLTLMVWFYLNRSLDRIRRVLKEIL